MSDTAPAAMQLNPQYRLQWEEAQECYVLLYPEGLVRLSGSASEILKLCREPVTESKLIETLQQRFPEADSLPDDVREFVAHARQQSWLVPAKLVAGE